MFDVYEERERGEERGGDRGEGVLEQGGLREWVKRYG